MSEFRSIYLVVPGSVESSPNPGLTPESRQEAMDMAILLPPHPPEIVCGTGKRHVELAAALGLGPTRWTPMVGSPEKLIRDGETETIWLGDGTFIPHERYTGTADRQDWIWLLLESLPQESVIITGRGTTKGILHLDHSLTTTIIRLQMDGGTIADYRIMTLVPEAV